MVSTISPIKLIRQRSRAVQSDPLTSLLPSEGIFLIHFKGGFARLEIDCRVVLAFIDFQLVDGEPVLEIPVWRGETALRSRHRSPFPMLPPNVR